MKNIIFIALRLVNIALGQCLMLCSSYVLHSHQGALWVCGFVTITLWRAYTYRFMTHVSRHCSVINTFWFVTLPCGKFTPDWNRLRQQMRQACIPQALSYSAEKSITEPCDSTRLHAGDSRHERFMSETIQITPPPPKLPFAGAAKGFYYILILRMCDKFV